MSTHEEPVRAACIVRATTTHPATWLALAWLELSGCRDQPAPNCLASTAPFATKLTEVSRAESTPGACAAFGPETFNADPSIGMAAYYARDGKGQPAYAKGSLAIRTAEIGSLAATAEGFDVTNTAPDGQLYSFGAFTSGEPDDDGICRVPTLTPTRLVLPELAAVPDDPATEEDDESFPGQEPLDITLTWSNVEVYVTPASFGTQMSGELEDVRRTPDGAVCTIRYRALGLSPAVSCQAHDEEGEPLTNPDGTPQLDPTLCDPEANPALGRFLGSGISPSTRYVCDPVIAYCVIDGDSIPALR